MPDMSHRCLRVRPDPDSVLDRDAASDPLACSGKALR